MRQIFKICLEAAPFREASRALFFFFFLFFSIFELRYLSFVWGRSAVFFI